MRGVTFSEFGNGKNVDMFVHAPEKMPGTPMQEAVKTAIQIREKFTKDLYVWCDYSVQHMYSQIAMQAFRMAGIEFVAAIPVLSNELSKRENDCTIAYCESRGIPYELFDIDVPALFNGPEFLYYGEKFPTTQPQMTIAGKFFDLLPDCCIVYPGFMMHVSTSDWTRTKNNGFMPFVPHETQEHAAEVSGKEYTNFQEHYVDMYSSWMFTQSYGDVLKSPTQDFVDNAPHRYYQYEMRTIKQAGFDIKPTTQKLIGIELLKSFFGHDKYDKELRQKLSPFGPLTMKYASLQYTVKVDTKLKEMLETHYEQNFDFLNKLF
tara:strand:+ start:4326 stop:5282 length:957 start_codon:yes stop_codon:yes gene_type:complete